MNSILSKSKVLMKNLDNKNVEEIKKIQIELRNRIKDMYVSSPYVCKSIIEDEFFFQDGINYVFKKLIKDEISKKPILIDKKDFTDPFNPPFPSNYVIEDNFFNFNTHRLFFNKFPIMDEHILLVTRDFISQYTHLTINEFRSIILLINTMNGIVFFNGGKNTGASQPRKHLQCIPRESMHNFEFGIFELLKNDSNLVILESFNDYIICKLNNFSEANIEHILIKYSNDMIEYLKNTTLSNVEENAEFCINLYKIMLAYLKLDVDEVNIVNDYSFLINSDFMLLIPRKKSSVKINNVEFSFNSASYTLALLVKNQQERDEIINHKILKDIISEL